MFQLDQPELDFGLYRIMHAKADRINRFLETELSNQIDSVFLDADQADQNQAIAAAKQTVIGQLGYDAFDENGELVEHFRSVPAAQDYLKAVSQAKSGKGNLSERAMIYDHLIRFFNRYYDGGDFMSRRYHVAENKSRAAAYAVPYDGSEVYLHWANKDQYYIKTTESFNLYSFDIAEAAKVHAEQASKTKQPGLLDLQDASQLVNKRIHFKLVDAEQGELNNNKESEKRQFFIRAEQPVALNEAGELEVYFEFRVATKNDAISAEQEKQLKARFGASNKGDLPNLYITQLIQDALLAMQEQPGLVDFVKFVQILAPTDKIKQRPLLTKYINNYTSKNTLDYFIHKDLGGFLQRELDFYIKNEIMRLDDIEQADEAHYGRLLKQIKTLRGVAKEIIQFLAQLEDFQKKLWLKKKFVTETQYCITLDRLAQQPGLVESALNNEAQRQEWVKLFAIDLAELDAAKAQGIDAVLAKEKFKYLVLDTQFFDAEFKDELLAEIEDLDEQSNGLLINSDNFQALNLIQETYQSKVKAVYIDPPYNTGSDGFVYKDNYQHSSWNSFILDRLFSIHALLDDDGAVFGSIDDSEAQNYKWLFDQVFGEANLLAPIYVQVRYANKTLSEDNDFQKVIEQLFFYSKNKKLFKPVKDLTDYPLHKFEWKITELAQGSQFEAGGKRCRVFYPGEYRLEKVESSLNHLKETWATGSLLRQKGSSGEFFGLHLATRKQHDGIGCLYKVDGIGEDGLGYRYFTGPQKESATKGKFFSGIPLQTLEKINNGDAKKEIPIVNFMDMAGAFGNCRHEGKVDILGGKKPEKLIQRVIEFISRENTDLVLDPFSGSGTTLAVAKKLDRKFIAVEQGNYFDAKSLVRLKHTFFGSSGGLDENPGGMCKYFRLEQYEDTLNNLIDSRTYNPESVPKDFILSYLLEAETAESPSLLNLQQFSQPRHYQLKIKRPNSDQSLPQVIDLVETFNWLIGLNVEKLDKWRAYDCEFAREHDPELPQDQHTRLKVTRMKQADAYAEDSPVYQVRTVEGWVRQQPGNDELRDSVLVIWRNLSDDPEKDSAVLEALLDKFKINQADSQFDKIYINGSHGLQLHGTAKTRLLSLEDTFMTKMWEGA